MGDVAPNQTLYVNNLNEKIKSHVMSRALYGLFSEFGPVLDVKVKRSMKLRGQAFVVFQDINTAAAAMKQLQGNQIFDKPMRIQFAREKSDVIAKMDGSYVPKKKRTAAAAAMSVDGEEEGRPSKVPSLSSSAFSKPKSTPKEENNPPNRVLFLQGLPEECTEDMLCKLFEDHGGFQSAEMVPGNKTMAFVHFETDFQASAAKEHLQGFRLTSDHALVINYAR